MTVYLITYDLNKETSRPKIVDAIKAYGSWAMLSESSYAIETAKTAHEVYQSFQPYIDGNDHLAVITLSSPWWAKNDQPVLDWLSNKL